MNLKRPGETHWSFHYGRVKKNKKKSLCERWWTSLVPFCKFLSSHLHQPRHASSELPQPSPAPPRLLQSLTGKSTFSPALHQLFHQCRPLKIRLQTTFSPSFKVVLCHVQNTDSYLTAALCRHPSTCSGMLLTVTVQISNTSQPNGHHLSDLVQRHHAVNHRSTTITPRRTHLTQVVFQEICFCGEEEECLVTGFALSLFEFADFLILV
jgi:hypothetical protein